MLPGQTSVPSSSTGLAVNVHLSHSAVVWSPAFFLHLTCHFSGDCYMVFQILPVRKDPHILKIIYILKK